MDLHRNSRRALVTGASRGIFDALKPVHPSYLGEVTDADLAKAASTLDRANDLADAASKLP